ncbi:MAG TPA: carbonic anhydrase family protein [Flavobacteriaceae bacterium]|nr:carbonic anhydrase family protein [Flavobacteriaceae bacterium]
MKAHTQETQASITPEKALQFLKEGNLRFQNNLKTHRNLLEQINETREGQFPFATILSCIDSRVSAELIFDQGLGDIFSIRVAGNIINEDILGSMEFGAKLAGSKLIVVLGHTRCGAISGACDDVKLGNLTHLIDKIKPAVNAVEEPTNPANRNSQNTEFVGRVAEKNVQLTIKDIREQSEVLRQMEKEGTVKFAGAMYDVSTGKVDFLDD